MVEPVTHDNVFSYGLRGGCLSFHVLIDGWTQHRREDPDILQNILQPPKPPRHRYGSYNDSTSTKDPKPDHYVFKPRKTKVAAKKTLLAALELGEKLAVPPDILKLEKQLKAEYQAAEESEKREREEKQKAEKEKERKNEKTTQEAEERSKAERQTWIEETAQARELRRIAKQKKLDRAVAEAVDGIMGKTQK